LFALQHHIDPEAGKQAANMIKMMMRKDDLIDATKVDPNAHQLLHRAFAAINQDHAIAIRNCMSRCSAVKLWDGAASGSERDKSCIKWHVI
jgi:hypothetical protein